MQDTITDSGNFEQKVIFLAMLILNLLCLIIHIIHLTSLGSVITRIRKEVQERQYLLHEIEIRERIENAIRRQIQ